MGGEWEESGRRVGGEWEESGRRVKTAKINRLPSGPKDGGLVVIPKTHDLFDKLFASRTDLCDKYPSFSTSPLLLFPSALLLLLI